MKHLRYFKESNSLPPIPIPELIHDINIYAEELPYEIAISWVKYSGDNIYKLLFSVQLQTDEYSKLINLYSSNVDNIVNYLEDTIRSSFTRFNSKYGFKFMEMGDIHIDTNDNAWEDYIEFGEPSIDVFMNLTLM